MNFHVSFIAIKIFVKAEGRILEYFVIIRDKTRTYIMVLDFYLFFIYFLTFLTDRMETTAS